MMFWNFFLCWLMLMATPMSPASAAVVAWIVLKSPFENPAMAALLFLRCDLRIVMYWFTWLSNLLFWGAPILAFKDVLSSLFGRAPTVLKFTSCKTDSAVTSLFLMDELVGLLASFRECLASFGSDMNYCCYWNYERRCIVYWSFLTLKGLRPNFSTLSDLEIFSKESSGGPVTEAANDEFKYYLMFLCSVI